MQQQKRYFVDCKLLISDKLIIKIRIIKPHSVSINQNLYKSGMTVQLTYRIQFENSDLITGF